MREYTGSKVLEVYCGCEIRLTDWFTPDEGADGQYATVFTGIKNHEGRIEEVTAVVLPNMRIQRLLRGMAFNLDDCWKRLCDTKEKQDSLVASAVVMLKQAIDTELKAA